MQIVDIKIDDIYMDEEFNSRGEIAPVDVIDLAKSIETQGLLQAVSVSPLTEEEQQQYNKKYRLLAGFRRTMAHRVLERNIIQAVIRDEIVSETDARIFNLSENLQRKDLNVLQEALALKKLHDLGVTEQETAERLNKSRGWVQVRYLLLKLPEEIQDAAGAGAIKQTQIRELYTIYHTAGKDRCFEAAKKCKDAAAMGKTISVNPKKINPLAKFHRGRREISTMMDHIFDTIGPGLYTRCLAWASGEISSHELYQDLETYARNNNLSYERPKARIG